MDAGFLAGLALAIACFLFIFWPERNPFVQADKTKVDSLLERKESIYANLRDLNFEYLAGKYPEEDYQQQRAILEGEAATVMTDIARLESRGVRRTRA
jgi:hypothetical protein